MDKTIQVVEPYDLYKWSKTFKHIQDRFWNNKYKVRRFPQTILIKRGGTKKLLHYTGSVSKSSLLKKIRETTDD